MRSGCEAGVAAGLCYVFDWIFHNPFCGLLFQCGCTWNCGPWSEKTCRGGWDDCNVHNAKKPWCPWCRAPQDNPRWAWLVSDALTIVLMVVAFVAARFRLVDTLRRSWWRRTRSTRNWQAAGWARMGGMRGKEHGSDDGTTGGGDEEEQEQPQRRPQLQAQAQGAEAEDDEPRRRTQQAGPNGPRDPLLQEDDPGGLPPRLLRWCGSMRGGAIGAEEGRHEDRRSLAIAAAAAVGAFVAWGTLMGVAFWLGTDYPYFLFFVK